MSQKHIATWSRATCLFCGGVIESVFAHDDDSCYCGNLFVKNNMLYAKNSTCSLGNPVFKAKRDDGEFSIIG